MRRTREKGFTLIELLISLAILGVMMAIAWGTTRTTLKAKKAYEEIQDRYREVRIALGRMSRDISMAYLSGNDDPSALEKRTFFVGESGGTHDELRFSALVHTSLFADANEGDQTIVAYYIASDPDDRSKDNLMRKETRRLPPAGEKWDTVPGPADILLADVKRFKVEYWNLKDKDWDDSWSTINTDGNAPRLPDRVKITVSFEDERDKEITFTTQTRIHMQEMLQFYAN